MAEASNSAQSPVTIKSLIFKTLQRPLEFGLIGAAVVLVLHFANRADILPKVFKGAGIELEFREDQKRVVQAVVDTAGGVDEIKAQVSLLQSEIQLLKKDIIELAGNRISVNASVLPEPRESKQDIAKTSRQLVDENSIIDGKGVIWIGTYDPVTNSWTDSSFYTGDLPKPSELAGEKLRLTSNVNVRSDFPERNESYFSRIKALGVAYDGIQGTVLSKPEVYERENGIQYWAEVEVKYRPYIGVE